jgi:hypothetical protein
MANLTDLVQERLTGRGASYRIRTPLDRFGPPATRALGELYRLGVLGVLARTAVTAGTAGTAGTASSEPKGAYSYQAVRPTPRPARPGPRSGSATPAPMAPMAPSHPQDDVTAMAAQGVPIDRIEDYIDRLPLEHDELSALWLLAWSQRARAETALRGPR